MSSITDSFSQISSVSSLIMPFALNTWGVVAGFLILLILTFALFLFGYYMNRGPFVALILSLYCGYAIYAAFPYQSLLPSQPPLTAFLLHAGLYLFFTAAFYIIMRRIAASDFIHISQMGLILLSLVTSAFIISVAHHIFSITTVYQFSPQLETLFVPAQYFFWWFIAPAIGLFFLAK